MELSILSQAVYYFPSLLAHLVAFVVAGVLFSRAKAPAALLAGGTALQLFASCGSYGLGVWTSTAYADGGLAMSEIAAVSGVVGVAVSILRALGEIAVVVAVPVAVRAGMGRMAGAASSGGTDPYGFPER